MSYFGYLTLASDLGALGSAPSDLHEILEGRSSTKVGLFPESLPNFFLLLIIIPFLHMCQLSLGIVTVLTNRTQHICHIPVFSWTIFLFSTLGRRQYEEVVMCCLELGGVGKLETKLRFPDYCFIPF